jgi:hypothetical protein
VPVRSRAMYQDANGWPARADARIDLGMPSTSNLATTSDGEGHGREWRRRAAAPMHAPFVRNRPRKIS